MFFKKYYASQTNHIFNWVHPHEPQIYIGDFLFLILI